MVNSHSQQILQGILFYPFVDYSPLTNKKSKLFLYNVKTKLEKIFGQILRKLRIESKLTQSELAGRSDLDRTFISLLERGERQPTLSSIFKLAHALNVSPVTIIQKVERELNENSSNSLLD